MASDSVDYAGLRLEELNYSSYLRVPELLDLQHEISEPPHRDEMFFIVIHQSFELWFKEILHETDVLVEYLQRDKVSRALKVVKRVAAILANLSDQIQLLATLTPVEFAGFRDRLRPASGFQSVQFREIEFAFGLQDRFFLEFFRKDPLALARLEARLGAPSVYDEFLGALSRTGVAVPDGLLQTGAVGPRESDSELVEALCQLYWAPGENYHWVLLCEALLDLDTLFRKWRAVHVLMVARTIGTQSGTGGSAGHRFLESRLPHRFFPELWEVRNAIHARVEGEREG
ncbi:MAG TPA: tryptophan 2,3-dioxygenase family protein [Planctomycetota bacterium]